jgi:hypothetical protein
VSMFKNFYSVMLEQTKKKRLAGNIKQKSHKQIYPLIF